MARTDIAFRGITRSTDIIAATPGDCSELLNARVKDGSVRPACPVEKINALAAGTLPATTGDGEPVWGLTHAEEEAQRAGLILGRVRKMVCHPAAKRWLLLMEGDDPVLRVLTEAYAEERVSEAYATVWAGLSGLSVTDIAVVGNTVCLATTVGMRYFLWKDNAYMWLGGIPRLTDEDVRVTTDVVGYSHTDDENVFNVPSGYNSPRGGYLARVSSYWYGSDEDKEYDKNLAGYISKGFDSIYAQKGFVDGAVFLVCFRLFDGSYVVCGSPILLLNIDKKKIGVSIDGKNYPVSGGAYNWSYLLKSGQSIEVRGVGFSVSFDFDVDFGDWEDIVSDIRVFTSGSISWFQLEKKLYNNGTQSEADVWCPAKVYGTSSYYVPIDGSSDISEYPVIESFTVSEYVKRIKEISSLSLLAEYDLRGNLKKYAENTSPTELALAEHFVTDGTIMDITGRLFTYNQRLHVFGRKEMLPSVLFSRYSFTADSTREADFHTTFGGKKFSTVMWLDIDCYVKIPTLNDSVSIKKYSVSDVPIRFPYKTVTYPYDSGTGTYEIMEYDESRLMLFGMLSYPDARAKKMWVHVKSGHYTEENPKSNGDGTVSVEYSDVTVTIDRIREFDLDGSTFFNYAQHVLSVEEMFPLKAEGSGTEIGTILADGGWREYSSNAAYWDALLDEGAGVEPMGNVISVSNAGNPFYFGGKNEVAVGNDSILGLMANVVTLSQGQFGEHPLYVFSGDGVYILSVDTSGEVAYRKVTPISTEKAVNANTLSATGRGVIYATGRGLAYREGEQSGYLSDVICGAVGREVSASPVLAGLKATMAANVDGLWGEATWGEGGGIVQDGTRFEEYIKTAVATYHADEDEVIVTASGYGYSYVYGMATKQWHKIAGSWDGVANRSGQCVAWRYGTVTDENGEHAATAFWRFGRGDAERSAVFLLTRPQTLGTMGWKRVMEAATHGDVFLTDGVGTALVAILGSRDGLHYELINHKDMHYNSRLEWRDAVMRLLPSRGYRYVAICFAGYVASDTRLTTVTIDAEQFYEGRL